MPLCINIGYTFSQSVNQMITLCIGVSVKIQMAVQRGRDDHIWRLTAKNAVTRMAIHDSLHDNYMFLYSHEWPWIAHEFFKNFSVFLWVPWHFFSLPHTPRMVFLSFSWEKKAVSRMELPSQRVGRGWGGELIFWKTRSYIPHPCPSPSWDGSCWRTRFFLFGTPSDFRGGAPCGSCHSWRGD